MSHCGRFSWNFLFVLSLSLKHRVLVVGSKHFQLTIQSSLKVKIPQICQLFVLSVFFFQHWTFDVLIKYLFAIILSVIPRGKKKLLDDADVSSV